MGRHNIGLESLQSFKIKCVKYYCLIPSAELIEENFKPSQ